MLQERAQGVWPQAFERVRQIRRDGFGKLLAARERKDAIRNLIFNQL